MAVRDSREEDPEGGRTSAYLEEKRLYGPGGVRWPALVAACVLVGVAFAPAGAVACALVAFLANHPIQQRWRGLAIILVSIFIVMSIFGVYLLKPKDGEGGGGVDGTGDPTGHVVPLTRNA